MNKQRLWIFKVIAILLPILLVGLTEVSLRTFHYGHNLDLFTEYTGNANFLVFNPHASEKYFPNPEFASIGNQELFKKEKDPYTFRIFVLGESTTIGYPYFHNGSFHRWLLYRLMHSYPEKNFEIVNLSLTAVNSYTVRGFAKELVNYQPDAVLIYCGQNEYYGALGVASAQSFGGNPRIAEFLLSLRKLRIVQFVTNAYFKLGGLKKSDVHPESTRMALMAGQQEVPYQSGLYHEGINQFKVNMEATIRQLQQHAIPVFISNLVSNEKDIPPFIQDGTPYFELANQALQQQDYKTAEHYFIQAKEHDNLRFRAPEEFNKIIDSLCQVFPSAHLVDTYDTFKINSKDHVLGDDLFTDHVHPNLEGYYLMSNAFYDALKTADVLPVSSGKEMTEEQLARQMPVSILDSLAGELRIKNLKGRWPFNEARYKNFTIPTSSLEEALAADLFRKETGWLDAHNKLYSYYVGQKQLDRAAQVIEQAVLEYPEDPVFYEKTAMVNGQLGNKEKATFYFRKSFILAPTFEKAHYLFVLCLMMDQPEIAVAYLDFAMAHNSKGMKLDSLKKQVDKLILLKQKLQENPSDVSLLKQIAELYQAMGNTEGAQIYTQKRLSYEK